MIAMRIVGKYLRSVRSKLKYPSFTMLFSRAAVLEGGYLRRLAISIAGIGLRTSLKASRTSKTRPTDLTTVVSLSNACGDRDLLITGLERQQHPSHDFSASPTLQGRLYLFANCRTQRRCFVACRRATNYADVAVTYRNNRSAAEALAAEISGSGEPSLELVGP